MHEGGGGAVCSFLRGKIIDSAPHDLYTARVHGAQSACNQNSIQNACFFFGGGGSGEKYENFAYGEMSVFTDSPLSIKGCFESCCLSP